MHRHRQDGVDIAQNVGPGGGQPAAETVQPSNRAPRLKARISRRLTSS
jgi:hypothetical protein